eukprot:765816-Hanusia_phi.AAC.3
MSESEWKDANIFQGDSKTLLFTIAPRFTVCRAVHENAKVAPCRLSGTLKESNWDRTVLVAGQGDRGRRHSWTSQALGGRGAGEDIVGWRDGEKQPVAPPCALLLSSSPLPGPGPRPPRLLLSSSSPPPLLLLSSSSLPALPTDTYKCCRSCRNVTDLRTAVTPGLRLKAICQLLRCSPHLPIPLLLSLLLLSAPLPASSSSLSSSPPLPLLLPPCLSIPHPHQGLGLRRSGRGAGATPAQAARGEDGGGAACMLELEELRDLQRARQVDRKMMFGGGGSWADSPDKFILDMVGITGASESRGGDQTVAHATATAIIEARGVVMMTTATTMTTTTTTTTMMMMMTTTMASKTMMG